MTKMFRGVDLNFVQAQSSAGIKIFFFFEFLLEAWHAQPEAGSTSTVITVIHGHHASDYDDTNVEYRLTHTNAQDSFAPFAT